MSKVCRGWTKANLITLQNHFANWIPWAQCSRTPHDSLSSCVTDCARCFACCPSMTWGPLVWQHPYTPHQETVSRPEVGSSTVLCPEPQARQAVSVLQEVALAGISGPEPRGGLSGQERPPRLARAAGYRHVQQPLSRAWSAGGGGGWRELSPRCLRHLLLGSLGVRLPLLLQRELKLELVNTRGAEAGAPPLGPGPPVAPVPLLPLLRRGRGAAGDHTLVPFPVVLQCVQNVLSIWVDQVGPSLPQRVDNVVYEAHLEFKKSYGQGV